MLANYTGNNATDWSFETDSTGDFNVYLDGSTQRITGSGVIKLNAWNYFVVSRSGSTVTAYCNNASAGTYTLSGTFGSASKAIRIGAGSAGTNNMFGYCAGVSLIDGSALDGTIPTAPPTDVSGTELLLNYTNAGIFDQTGKNNLETVGNAQIDTSVKKYGTGSMEFDGTGDYLVVPVSENYAFGTGDFTCECWFYIAGNSPQDEGGNRQAAIFCDRGAGVATPANGISLLIAGDGSTTGTGLTFVLRSSGSTYTITYTGSIAQTTWHHVAVVRSGTEVDIYLNGSSVANNASFGYDIVCVQPMFIGFENITNNTRPFNGFIDDLRFTKGVARYTSAFTPPAKEFPNL
jgi:hypothetical protein